MLAAVLCLWWLCAEGALAKAGTVEPQDAGEAASVIADGGPSGADETIPEELSVSSGGVPDAAGDTDGIESDDAPAAPDGPDAGVPAESDAVTMLGPTGGAGSGALRSVEPAPAAPPEPIAAPAPVEAAEPVPARPSEPASPPEPAHTESIPIVSPPAAAPPEPEVRRVPVATPAPRAVDRAPDSASVVAPASSILVTDPASVHRTEPGGAELPHADVSPARGAGATGATRASALSPSVPGDADPAAGAAGTRDGAVTSSSGAGGASVGYSAIVGRSAPAARPTRFGAGGGLADTALEDIAAPDARVQEAISRPASFTATVTLPGGSAPSDSPLARIADYLIYGGTTASGAPPVLLAVVAPTDSWLVVPPAGGGAVVGAGAGASRPAHAHPLSRPG